MNKPHKHAELIKQWADGAEIESQSAVSQEWCRIAPNWNEATTYRVKPQPVECWVIEYIDGTTGIYDYSTAGEAKEFKASYPDIVARIIHMREVVE
jgi:hypothetical protein